VKREVLPARKAPPAPLLCDPLFVVMLALVGGVNAYGVVAWAVTWPVWLSAVLLMGVVPAIGATLLMRLVMPRVRR
jgi:hypothetical protein